MILYCLSFTLVIYTAVEFFIAQSPFQVKGFVLCLLAGFLSIYICIGLITRKIIHLYPINVPLGCAFYHHIICFILATAVFTLYVLISKWYKLRTRDNIVPIHMLAENYFEKNYEQEQRYLQQYHDGDST